jgi:hypothetical protein
MVRRIVVLMLKIFVPLVLGTTLVGWLIFDGKLAIGAALVGMLISFLISIPMVLACFEEEVIDPHQ